MFAGAVFFIDGVTPDAMDDQTTFRANEYLLELSLFYTVVRTNPDITTAQRQPSQSSQGDPDGVGNPVRSPGLTGAATALISDG